MGAHSLIRLTTRAASPAERIVEFTDLKGNKGGLISIGHTDDGKTLIDIYRVDSGIEVRLPTGMKPAIVVTL